ncbi:MAG TPA: restriction endonuclease [Byssovorax sp.]|jgi:restriction system protein
MPVPSFDQFIGHVLRHLAARSDGAPEVEVYDAAAALAGLTEDDKAELQPGGGATYRTRIAWAFDKLKRSGLASSPRIGVWQLTAEGLALAKRSAKIERADVDRITNVLPDARLRAMPIHQTGAPPTSTPAQSPVDRIEAALRDVRESVARDLLESAVRASPALFEKVLLDLLGALGYRARRGDLERVGGQGDGLEGTVGLDALGFARVLVHARRSSAQLGVAQLQAFVGSLQVAGLSQGLLLTTGTFAREARHGAATMGGSVVLLDGAELAELMIEHGVGVARQTIEIPRVAAGYFDGG